MATRPLPSLDMPSLLSLAYILRSVKLHPVKSKWAVFIEINFGNNIFSTCNVNKYQYIIKDTNGFYLFEETLCINNQDKRTSSNILIQDK